jgi:hypothetical protein
MGGRRLVQIVLCLAKGTFSKFFPQAILLDKHWPLCHFVDLVQLESFTDEEEFTFEN